MGLQTQTNWRTAYMDNTQFLLIDIDTPQGRKLLDDILNQQAKFPNEFSKELTLAKNMLAFKDEDPVAPRAAACQKAFEIDSSQAPMQLLVHEAAYAIRTCGQRRPLILWDGWTVSLRTKTPGRRRRLHEEAGGGDDRPIICSSGQWEYREKYGGLKDQYEQEQKLISESADGET